MADRASRLKTFRDQLRSRVLVLDGAMGTQIQALNLTAADFGGELYEGCNEFLCITKPDAIFDIHLRYLEAGADIVETNTFGGTPFVLGEFSLSDRAHEINKVAAELAMKAVIATGRGFVAGSMGPTTKSLSLTGGITFEALVDAFEAQAEGLWQGGADFFLIETSQDMRNIKAALLGIDRILKRHQYQGPYPVAVSGTIETMGTTLAGQTADAFSVSLENRDLLYIGLNCATGPEFMTDHIRSLAEISPSPIACVPNAGLPDEDGLYLESPQMMAKILNSFAERGWINLIGGCCGTTPDHIRVFASAAKSMKNRPIGPKIRNGRKASYLSGLEVLEITEENRPVLVGERSNVIGSRLFKNLIDQNKWEEASEVARRQVKNQAQIVDVCLANPDRDEFEDMQNFLDQLVRKVGVPMMIDSTDSKVVELALKFSQGKAIINSINLEDGEERFEEICPLARAYGAALVVGCIDDDREQGMGVTVARKVEIARRSFDLLTQKYGIPAEDIYWDALVFPIGTGDANYMGAGAHTIDGVRALKQEFPGTHTVLGISNVSFGLPTAGREILNSVFLYHCTKAGLDLALVNTEKLARFADIPEAERTLCDDLIWNRGPDPIGAFANFYKDKSSTLKARVSHENLTAEERLSRAVVEGNKETLIADLDEVLTRMKPLDTINGPLMAGMDEVGRLFNDNKLIVAEVLQSAEVMKAAVNHLEPLMERTTSSLRGRVVLATVKGDVHDIGKNLVEIILSNNGFEVINLGIKIPSHDLIEAAKKHAPQILGLSGLLVKSAQQMVETASDLAAAGIFTPILVGGAALTRNFVDRKIAPAYREGFVEYANDAMHGLELAKIIVDRDQFVTLQSNVGIRRANLAAKPVAMPGAALSEADRLGRSSQFSVQENPLPPPDFERHKVQFPLSQVWEYVNPLMLLGRHLGVSGEFVRGLYDPAKAALITDKEGYKKAQSIFALIAEVKTEFLAKGIQARGVYQFFSAHSEQNTLVVNDKSDPVRWEFQRQTTGDRLCLADLINPRGAAPDSLAIFVTTTYGPIREWADQLKSEGQYLKSHIVSALGLETAEATAELLHTHLRSQWGFPDSPETKMMDRFQAKYRGKRYSFGYPACPELQYQQELFKLLSPQDIGVQLSEGFMMEPEASVSALVFSHPQAIYFGSGASQSAA